MKPRKMDPHRLEEIRTALDAKPRVEFLQWTNSTVFDLVAHISALESELASARDAALEEADGMLAAIEDSVDEVYEAPVRRDTAYQTVKHARESIRGLKSKPAAVSVPCAVVGCVRTGEHETHVAELADEASGLLPKKRVCPRMSHGAHVKTLEVEDGHRCIHCHAEVEP